MFAEMIAFLTVAGLVIIVPGQDMALTLQTTLLGGRRSGVFTALGVVTGLVTWTIATSLGLAALLLASEPIFVALKFAGAAYLVFLGGQALFAALRRDAPAGQALAGRPTRRLTPLVAYRRGVLSNLGNPKIAVFFTSLLPQFTPTGNATFLGLLLLGLIFCALTLGWLIGYAFVVARAGDWLRRPRIRRSLDGLMGCVLIALGLRLATARR